MARSRITTTDLHDALHQLLDENPLRADEGHPEHRLFVYHGKPVELNATLLHHFGASINQLKSLDAAIWSVENDWDKVKHPLRRRYTELAWTCLSHLGGGDTPGAWANSHDYAFGPRDVTLSWIARDYDRTLDGRRRPGSTTQPSSSSPRPSVTSTPAAPRTRCRQPRCAPSPARSERPCHAPFGRPENPTGLPRAFSQFIGRHARNRDTRRDTPRDTLPGPALARAPPGPARAVL